MSDLSWLNPTPHAIAVYASRPLSPVAAQHSLPSGRYSLLGPDFHRLDRTSLRLAHSFDHLAAAAAPRPRAALRFLHPSPRGSRNERLFKCETRWRHSPLTFAAVMIGVQRAISLLTSTASGC